MQKKIDIRQLSIEQLTNELSELGEKPFRAKQIMNGFGKKEQSILIR